MYILGIPFVSVKAYSDLEMVSTWVCGSKIFSAKRDTVICTNVTFGTAVEIPWVNSDGYICEVEVAGQGEYPL